MDRPRLVIPVMVALLWIAVPVQAGAGQAPCPEGAGCVWNQTDFRGKRAKVPSNGCIDTSIRSAVNASDQPLQFFMGSGCYGVRVATLKPGQEAAEIRAGSASANCSFGVPDPCTDDVPLPEAPS